MDRTNLPPLKDLTDILIVCAGNVCRSPMAEAALRAKLYERGIDGIRVHSAGTHGGSIPFATPEAILTAERHQLDLSHHRSSPLTHEMIEEAGALLVMDHQNLQWILDSWPEFESKVFLVTNFRNDRWKDADVRDPYQLSADFYEAAFDLIDGSLEAFVDYLAGTRGEEDESGSGA